MTNYTHLVRAVEDEYGRENIKEHLDDPRILQFKKLLGKPQFVMTKNKLKQLQFYFDQGNQNIEDIANHTSTPIGVINESILMKEIDLTKWKLKNKQFNEAQKLLDQGRKDSIRKETGMNYARISFLFKNNFFDTSEYLKNRRVIRIEYDHFKAQNLLDMGMKKRQISKEIGITVDELAREIRKGDLSETNWLKWRLGIYKK